MNEISRFTAETLLNSLPAGLAITASAWLATRLLARHGSSLRFSIWLAALSAIAFLPWVGTLRDSSSRTLPTLTAGVLTLPGSLARYLAAAWIAGVVLGLAHIGVGMWRLRRLRATCRAVDPAQLDSVLRATVEEAQRRRRLIVCSSDALRVPAAIGYFRPMVVFPTWALAEIPPLELNAILMHEIAHLRRYDDWTNLAQKLVKALFFFHPAVWFIESRLTLEREMACDDAVLASNFNPRAYAESLVGLAEKSFLRRSIQLAQAAVGHVQQLKLRLVQILSKERVRQGSAGPGKFAVASLLLAGTVAAYGLVRLPRLVGFSGAPAITASAMPQASMPLPDNHLQPVALRFAAPDFSRHVLPQPRAHVTHRAAPRLSVLVASGTIERRVANDELSATAILPVQFSQDLMAAPVLVIYQGAQVGPDGLILWRVTVWHLNPAQRLVLSGEPPKQI